MKDWRYNLELDPEWLDSLKIDFNQIFKVDPSEMMIAFCEMMKNKIIMPAHLIWIILFPMYLLR